MIHRKFLILFVIFVIFAAGCSADSPNSSNSSTIVNSARSDAPANQLPASSNTAPTDNPALPGNVTVKKIPMQPVGVKQSGPTQSAPDNSEISSALAENFVQTRTFKNHPQIEKVEVTTLTKENNRKVIKVYLKGGKVKEIPEGKIGDPMTESADNILKAAQ